MGSFAKVNQVLTSRKTQDHTYFSVSDNMGANVNCDSDDEILVLSDTEIAASSMKGFRKPQKSDNDSDFFSDTSSVKSRKDESRTRRRLREKEEEVRRLEALNHRLERENQRKEVMLQMVKEDEARRAREYSLDEKGKKEEEENDRKLRGEIEIQLVRQLKEAKNEVDLKEKDLENINVELSKRAQENGRL